ncbi:MAG: CinA family nicotinamide mononucleotide deamidase-related protein [Deinococcales bacterium]
MPTIRTAEVLSVGTELLLGEIDDTNSAELARSLAGHGADVYWTQRVGDNLERLRVAIDRALQRSDLVVLTGGLGPTDDDLTRDAVALAAGEAMTLDPELEGWLRRRFASFHRAMPERNLRQAQRIPSAEALPNPIGTAPGWLVSVRRGDAERTIVTLPGPPREMRRMWQHEALPRLTFAGGALYTRTVKSHGIGESDVAEMLGALTQGANPSVATYAKRDGVHVRVAAKGDSREDARRRAAAVEQAVTERLGDAVWGFDDDALPDLVVGGLERAGARAAVAECASGGALADLLSDVTGAEEAFAGAVIAWNADSMATLGVARDLLARLPSAAAEVVVALASAVRALFDVDYGVAVGPAHPQQGSGAGDALGPEGNESAATRVVIAIVGRSGTTVRTLTLPPLGRAWLRERLAFTSLFLLRSALR